MAFWLARDRNGQDSDYIQRFDPRFWTINFPRPMMASVTTASADSLRIDCDFYTEGDLAGLIWTSEDMLSHPLLRYETQRDYARTTLRFQWRSMGLIPLDQPNGPTLSIEGRDETGAERVWYVRLWNYAEGSPTNAQITLPFSNLESGYGLPGEPVAMADIDRMFISLVPPDYVAGSDQLLPPGQRGRAIISAISCDGDKPLLVPLVAKPTYEALKIESSALFTAPAYTLPDAISGPDDSDFGPITGLSTSREISLEASSNSLRYYDTDRDYLPSVQRTNGRAATAGTEIVQFPGALTSNNAKRLIEARRLRTVGTQAGMRWRIAEIDPDLQPGTVVQMPGQSGKWTIQSSEWRENGIELELIRLLPNPSDSGLGDAGVIARSANLAISPTVLRAFELPWDGNGSPSQRTVFVAGSGTGNDAGTAWNGAALFSETAGKLDPIGKASLVQAVGGILTVGLQPSASLLFEPGTALTVTVHNAEMIFASTTLDGLARGDNTLLVGSELLQFVSAEQTSERDWILRGLLRGRGGTEAEARTAHPLSTQITLIDRNLTMLDSSAFNPAAVERLAGIGKGDTQHASVEIENPGLSLKPLTPVHGQLVHHDDGGVTACWIRRARGAWQWLDGVDSPLNEEQELYCVSAGSPIAPNFTWQTEQASIDLPTESASSFSGLSLWVQQVGAHAKSAPLYLGALL